MDEATGVIILLKAFIAAIIGSGAKEKGYGFWEFFFAAILLDPLTCTAVLIALPRLVNGRVLRKD